MTHFNSYSQIYGIKLSWYGTVDLLRLFGAVLYFSVHRDAIVVCAYDGFADSSFFLSGYVFILSLFRKSYPEWRLSMLSDHCFASWFA